MVVPAWLLVLLGCFSSMLVILILTVGVIVLKNWWRIRKYDRLKSQKSKIYAPGKTAAFLKGYESTYKVASHNRVPFIPLTSTQTIQSIPTKSGYGSDISTASTTRGKIAHKKFEKKGRISHYFSTMNRSASFDDRMFSEMITKPYNSMKSANDINITVKSPNYPVSPGASDTSGSRRDSINGHSNFDYDGTETIYMHSEYMTENRNISDAVISYEQEGGSPDISRGSLGFLLEYSSTASELSITVKNALDLPSVTGEESINSYVNLCIVPEDFLWKRTELVLNDRDPIYNESFCITDVLYHKLREYTLCFYIMEVHQSLGERVIGKVLYPLSDLRAENLVDVRKELIPP